MKKLRVGIIGLGGRGLGLCRLSKSLEQMEITAICDNYQPFIDRTVDELKEQGCEPAVFTDYHQLLDCGLIDAVLIITSWEAHIPMAIEALEKGIPCGMEVCGAFDLQQCWDLVHTWERTRTPFMFLENCCYGRDELLLLNMVKKGVFGDISHCDGCYAHDLRREVCKGKIGHHYRYKNYLHRNCENYPTHEIGPLAKLLKINHGNRFLTLNSVSSKSIGMKEYIKKRHPDDEELMNAEFSQGDVLTTIIRCAGGETITIKLDTTLPRFSTRGLEIHGTKAYYDQHCKSFYIDPEEYTGEVLDWSPNWNNIEEFYEKYDHPLWKRSIEEGFNQGHGGMDGILFKAFIDCVLNGYDMPIDVYDAATWMAITCLSEQSIIKNGAPVMFPDFTRGEWKETNPPKNPSPYHLN